MTDTQLQGGEILKQRRESLGLTLKEAGERAEPPFSPGYLSQLESGKVITPNVGSLNRLSQTYAMSPLGILAAFGVDIEVHPKQNDTYLALRIGQEVLKLSSPTQETVIGYVRYVNKGATS